MNSDTSNTHASEVKVARSHGAKSSEVARIADAIVDLVERTDGPVPLNRIDEQVRGFRAPHGPSWSYFIRHDAGEAVIWNGMTKAGYKALRHVLNERQVALQPVNVLPYIFENVRLLDPAWQPVVLLPKRAANFDGPYWPFRLERVRGKTGFDGLERVSSQSLLDMLEVPQRSRTAGTYRRLAKLMTELGWTAVRVRDLTRGGYKEQVRGYCRVPRL